MSKFRQHLLSWIIVLILASVLAVPQAQAEKLSAKISQCKKTKVRNDEGKLVYVFTVVSRQVSHRHNSEATLYVEAEDAAGKKYFGFLRNKESLLSFVTGGSYADVTWKFEVNVDSLKNPMIKAYYLELIDATDETVLDTAKYAVSNFEKWKKNNANSKTLPVSTMKPDPSL